MHSIGHDRIYFRNTHVGKIVDIALLIDLITAGVWSIKKDHVSEMCANDLCTDATPRDHKLSACKATDLESNSNVRVYL